MKAGRIAFAALLIFALVALPLAIYTAAYLWLGEQERYSSTHDDYVEGKRVWVEDGLTIERIYPHLWQATVFDPAGKLEAWCRGVEVRIIWGNSPAVEMQKL